MLKFPPPPEPPKGTENYLEQLAEYYQQLKDYYDRASKTAATQLSLVRALLNPKLDAFGEQIPGDKAVDNTVIVTPPPTSDATELVTPSITTSAEQIQPSSQSNGKVLSDTFSTEQLSQDKELPFDEEPKITASYVIPAIVTELETASPVQVVEISPLVNELETIAIEDFPPNEGAANLTQLTLFEPQPTSNSSVVTEINLEEVNGSVKSNGVNLTTNTQTFVVIKDQDRFLEEGDRYSYSSTITPALEQFVEEQEVLTNNSDCQPTLITTDETEQLEQDNLNSSLKAATNQETLLTDASKSNEDSLPDTDLMTQIEQLLSERRGTILQLDFIVFKLYGVLDESALAERKAVIKQILIEGEEDRRWFEMPDAPGCWTIDLNEIFASSDQDDEAQSEEFYPTPMASELLGISPERIIALASRAVDDLEEPEHYYKNNQGRFFWSQKAIDFLKSVLINGDSNLLKASDVPIDKSFSHLTIEQAIEQILASQPDEIFKITDLIPLLYGNLPGNKTRVVKDYLPRILLNGTKQGLWTQVKRKKGYYQAKKV